MQDMFIAIWQQDFDYLSQMGQINLLIGCLLLILFLESAFVFLPLPGDSLVLLAGGLLAAGIIPPEVVYLYIPLVAGIGSMLAYWQGRALAHTRFMFHMERIIPNNSLPKATRLLEQHGLLAMFSSRFIPFVRVLTPMLMGITKLPLGKVLIISLVSAFCWSMVLSTLSSLLMKMPFLEQYQKLFGQALLVISLILFVLAITALIYRLFKSRQS
jgi:membrane protein DedA with SNARE-associated domain